MSESNVLLPYLKLQLNIDHPDLEECYMHGYESALADIQESDNPFSAGSKAHDQWTEGWWAGFYGDAPLFAALEQEESSEIYAANDQAFQSDSDSFFVKLLEISGMIVVSAFVGYQLIELVA